MAISISQLIIVLSDYYLHNLQQMLVKEQYMNKCMLLLGPLAWLTKMLVRKLKKEMLQVIKHIMKFAITFTMVFLF